MATIAAWLAEHGEGRIPAEMETHIRRLLLDDVAGVDASEVVVRREIDEFIRNGRISNSNLNRLHRRIERRSADGNFSARSARTGTDLSFSGVSSFAKAPSFVSTGGGSTPASARERGRLRGGGMDVVVGLTGGCTSGSANSTRPPGIAEERASGEAATNTWSEIAKHSKNLEVVEKVQKKSAIRAAQLMMRNELLQQIDIKLHQNVQAREEALRLFELQKAEVSRFEASEKRKQEDAKTRILDVNRERDLQSSRMSEMREMEAQQKREEEKKLIQKVRQDLEQEQKDSLEKKTNQQKVMAKLSEAWESGRPERDEAKRVQVESERQNVREYQEMLEMQEQRNRQHIPPIRGGTTVIPLKSSRRGEETYSEANIMRQLHESIHQKDEADRQKEQRQRSARQDNQDFLAQQIELRNQSRRETESKKGDQRASVQAATEAFFEAERARIEQQRLKNIQHREELQDQIRARRRAPTDAANTMSAAEVAINRHLLHDARDLKCRMAQMATAGEL